MLTKCDKNRSISLGFVAEQEEKADIIYFLDLNYKGFPKRIFPGTICFAPSIISVNYIYVRDEIPKRLSFNFISKRFGRMY